MPESLFPPTAACADRAVAHALEVAGAMGSTVVFLFAMDTVSARREGVVNVEEARAALTAHGAAILARTERAAEDAGVRTERVLAEGVPADVIAQRAADFDLAVMGSHGKGLWRWVTVGSVTQAVLHHVSCPVLVVRAGREGSASE